MRNAMKLLFKRKPVDANTDVLCIWNLGCVQMGKGQPPKRNIAVATVRTTRDCGHSDMPVPTCADHLAELHLTGGVSPVKVACADCGEVGFSRITKVEDLDV